LVQISNFKRIFDATVLSDIKIWANYEVPYNAYKDMAYIPILNKQRHKISLDYIFYGTIGLPNIKNIKINSVHYSNTGYIYLRKGNISDYNEIRINYKNQFDRSEHDRLTTFFYHNNRQIDFTIGRITYFSDMAEWMYDTAAHNTIVINGNNSKDLPSKLLKIDTNSKNPYAIIETYKSNPLYENVSQKRVVALVEKYFVVYDHIISKKDAVIDRYQYGKYPVKILSKHQEIENKISNLPKEAKFHDIRVYKLGKSAHLLFKNNLHMFIISDYDFNLVIANTKGGYGRSYASNFYQK